MKSGKYILFGILVIFTMVSCQKPIYYFQAQPVDLNVVNDSGKVRVAGSSLLQLPDSFVWGGSPIRINDQYYLFFSTWESGPYIPNFGSSWMLYSKILLCSVQFSG